MSTSVLTSSWASYGKGSYWAFNNVWGAGSLVNGVDYTQSISFDSSTFPNGVTMSWNWPSATSVLSYPEIVYGAQQSQPAPSGVSLPPSTQVANFTNLSAQYSFSISGQTNNFDVGFDLWLTSQPNGGQSSIKDELMVFVHDPWGHVNGASNFGTINNSGIYVSYNWGNSVNNWNFIALVPSADQLSGTISLSDIMKTLVWDGVLTGNEYVSGIELGAEVGGGSGSLTINNLSYQWIANPTINGTAGNDTFNIAAVGGNNIVGNGGIDTVIYNDPYSQFQFKPSGSELLVMEKNNISTLDVLNGVTYIKFSDGTYNAVTSTFTPATTAPTVASFSPDSGTIGDGITNATTLTLTGTAASNSAVTMFDGTTQLGTAMANASGMWTFTTSTLANGAHSFTVTDTDAAGNTSVASSALAVTVDTVAPNAPVIANDAIVNTNEVMLTGTAEVNSAVNVFDGTAQLGTATTNASGTWSFTTGQLSVGDHSFTATATDAAGNTSLASQVVDPTISNIGVTINGTSGADTIDATHGINGVFPTSGDDTINGGAGNDIISGLGGNDIINGGSGADMMMGGTGNDTYVVDNTGDKVIENSNEGTDTILSSVTYTLPANVENMTLTGTARINGTGNGLDNVISGNNGNNILTGLGGNDTITGKGGSDTFVFGSNFGKDIITDFQATGSSHDVLQFSHNNFSNFAAVLAHAAQVGSDVVITVDAADTVTLQNVHLSSLQKNDIHIV